jgi:23S rRNA (guanosine2251-2'-O)-methyltransferase
MVKRPPHLRPTGRSPRRDGPPERLWIYGLHAAAAALANPRRKVRRMLASRNALMRLKAAGAEPPALVEEVRPVALDRLLGADAVHQGVALEVEPLPDSDPDLIAGARLLVVLDQVTDPHNVGAILRSAAAFAADAVVTTTRHAPGETGVLAKAASGALDVVPLLRVTNLGDFLEELGDSGFARIGLDSAAETEIGAAIAGDRIALVLGAEGKGLRQRSRSLCDRMARIPGADPIGSLNVSNAAALALYLARKALDG